MTENDGADDTPSMSELRETAESLEQATAWLARHVNISRTIGTVRPGHTDLELEDGALDAFLIALRTSVDNVREAALELASVGEFGASTQTCNSECKLYGPPCEASGTEEG